jgi:hypothetical protein
MQLSWWEIGLLEVGERVIVLEPIPVSDLIVPTNTSAVVDMNTLFEDGTIALMPDDLDLRAQLQPQRGSGWMVDLHELEPLDLPLISSRQYFTGGGSRCGLARQAAGSIGAGREERGPPLKIQRKYSGGGASEQSNWVCSAKTR